jgi:tRNA-specific 2-thiouridylase
MSGGLDSSVVAALCVDRGYEVIGMTLHMFKEGSRCCSIEDVERARRVCDHLGIDHHVINAMEEFREIIIEPFITEYAGGRTPSPCILCNEYIKFGTLHRRALQLGCTRIATGHYARVDRCDGRLRLLRPRDLRKDQTYFLHRLSQDQLARCLFPLESMTKAEVADYAESRQLPVRRSPGHESQDLCFVPDDGHPSFVEAHRPELRREGEIVNVEGAVLGVHPGFHRYTIGQRSGLGVAAPARMYVKQLDPELNRVVVGFRDEILSNRCTAERVHWIAGHPPKESFTCRARIRYRHEAASCRVRLPGDRRMELVFDEPQFAVTPGQAAVLYDGDEILGGGWIRLND